MNNKDKEKIKFKKKPELKSFIALEKSNFHLFCEICSIRGMHKITKAPTLFLKALWIAFVVCMTTMLFLVTGLLIKDYLNYYTAWHTRTDFDDDSDFPSITLCSHNPFSLNANKFWNQKNTLSPYHFRERLKKMIVETLNSSSPDYEMSMMLFHDKIENYYMNVDYDYSVNISHGADMLKYCAIYGDTSLIITKNCDTANNVMVGKLIYSHQKYFNCWTIQRTPSFFNNSIVSLIILVSLTPAADVPELKNAFLMDILERGEGLKLVIHEPDSYPEIEEKGIDVQPGKMNNIKYEPLKWGRYSTPRQKCKNVQSPMIDLNRKFNYSFSMCMNYNLQLKLIEKCNCMNALFPRPFLPNATVGYCLNLNQENISLISARIKCAQEIMNEARDLKKLWENTKCMQRCNYFTYTTELSITKWVPSYEKLFRIADLINKTEIFISNMTDPKSKQDYISYVQSNISDVNKNSDAQFMDLDNENKFTYISLTRKTKNTVIKYEALVLDLAILMSRIGGLCSLFIGLTVSFFIELVEFGYLICCRLDHLRKTARLAKRINNSRSQICASNNSIYDIPTTNPYDKNAGDIGEERVDFIKESDSPDNHDNKTNTGWGKDLDKPKFSHAEYHFSKT